MARWFTRTLPVAVDVIFPLIADFVAGGTGWDLYDDISAHIKVYRCTGGATTFYLEVDHTTAGTIIFKLATGWDTGTHAYVGYKSAAQYLACVVGDYAINGDESTLYIMNLNCSTRSVLYAGFTEPIDASDVNSICLSGENSALNSYGPFSPQNTTQLWLYNTVGGNGGALTCVLDEAMLYGYNSESGVLLVNKLRVTNTSDANAYRANAKFMYPCSSVLPYGFSLGDPLYISGIKYRFRRNYSTTSFLLIRWE